MKKFLLFFILLLNCIQVYSEDFVYILNEECVTDLYEKALVHFEGKEIFAIKHPQGLRLRFEIVDLDDEYYQITMQTHDKIMCIKDFLAKFENPVIIEVHINDFADKSRIKLKKWEVSTIIANRIQSVLSEYSNELNSKTIYSVGYGEFMPTKNTPYNGGNFRNRVDIMILCSISGE